MTLFRLAQAPNKLADILVGRLAESFAYLAGVADALHLRQSLSLVADRLRGLRLVPPHLGCLYLQIVEAVDGGDEAQAESLCSRLLDILARPWSLEIAPYSREELGEFYRDFAGVLFDDSYGDQPITAPPEVTWDRARVDFDKARALVHSVAPALHAEMEAFWSRIYVGVSNPAAGKAGFGGVTSLILWGGTFANADQYDSEIKAAEFMVHEVTHALLFALACDEPLVLNPPEELFASPLRRDPRPMDGIFHATLVCARVAEFYSDLIVQGATTGTDREILARKAEDNRARFLRGHSTVLECGRISTLAAELLQEAAERIRTLSGGH